MAPVPSSRTPVDNAHRRAASTIRDVARLAGVSVTTVSRVLNGKGDVAAETALRVQQVIDDLGYESSLAARSLRSSRTQVIGLVLPDMDHTWAVEVVRAASRAVTGTPYDLFVMASGTRSHTERGRWEQQQITRLNGALTDGVIVAVPDAPVFRTEHPLVALDSFLNSDVYPSVNADNFQGARDAVQHLLDLGHRRIGFVQGLGYLESANQRLRAFEQAHADAGIPLDPTLVLPGDFSTDAGVQAMRQFLALAQPPTAIFAANDDTAFGVLAAARAAGLRVPQDLSVVGFDNVPEAAVAHPPLTTVDQQVEWAVRTSVSMLIDLVEGRMPASLRVVIPAHLVIRESTAPPAAPPTVQPRPHQRSRLSRKEASPPPRF